MILITSKLIVGFLLLLFFIRLLGKKHLAQLTPSDIVYFMVFGGIVEESVYDEQIPIWQMAVALAIWVALSYLFETLVYRSDRLRKIVKGVPICLIYKGTILSETCRKQKLEMEQLRSILRTQGIFSLKEVYHLFLEPDGTFSVQKYAHLEPPTNAQLNISVAQPHLSYLLISEGEIHQSTLQQLGLSDAWLLGEVGALHTVLLAEWSIAEGLHIQRYNTTEEHCVPLE